LKQLEDFTANLFNLLERGETHCYIQQIFQLSVVPFRKVVSIDDRRCFSHVGVYVNSLCPFLELPYPELQLEAAKAIKWYAQNCGPIKLMRNQPPPHNCTSK
jgi:hypothetical protein